MRFSVEAVESCSHIDAIVLESVFRRAGPEGIALVVHLLLVGNQLDERQIDG